MPNTFAHLVFYMWPLVVYVLFQRRDMLSAIVWSMVLGSLLLPARVGIDLPLFPTIARDQITPICVALMCILTLRQQRVAERWKTRQPIRPAGPVKKQRKSLGRLVYAALLLLAFCAPVVTVMSNSDPIIAGPRVIPGLSLYDAFSVIGATIFTLLPFMLGRWFLNTHEAHVTLMRVLCLALAGYAFLALWEVRMSPQLNRHIYGFVSSSFGQHMRAGGFRPLVFLYHGLTLGVFLSMAVISTGVLWRQARRQKRPSALYVGLALWLILTLIMSKVLGATAITFALLPVVLLLGARTQMLIAACLSAVVLFYPILRGTGYAPTDQIYNYVLTRDAERAQSFGFRLENEERLLEKANQRPFVGWGTWGRNRVYDENTGRDLSVTDGAWIIIIGTFGWIGYIAQFGLLTVPVFLFALRRRKLEVPLATSGLIVVLTANLLDLLPNAALTPITWLVAGSVLGRYIVLRESPAQQKARAPRPGAVLPEPDPDLAQEDTPPAAPQPPKIKVRKPRQAPGFAPVPARGNPRGVSS